MRPLLSLIAVFLLLPVWGYAQNDTTYYDADGNKADFMAADYYRVVFPKTSGKNKVEEHYILRDRLKISEYYSSLDSQILDGPYVMYDNKGHKVTEGDYVHRNQNGVWKEYYRGSDSLHAIINYSMGEYDGKLKSYYKDGKLKRSETYIKDASQGGKCFAEDGKEISFTPYRIMPTPDYELKDYLSINIKYPDEARENEIQGRVLVKFTINEDGSIDHLMVIRSVHPLLDNEALRVVRKMPKWKPVIIDGEPQKIYFTIPITFKLS